MRDGYVPNLKVPGKRGPSQRMWLTLTLCLVLPPVGLMLLWGKVRCPMRGKLCLTCVSVAVMIAAMTYVLEARGRSSYVVPQPPATYAAAQPTPAPAQAQTAPQAQTVPQEGTDGLADGVIPANPLG